MPTYLVKETVIEKSTGKRMYVSYHGLKSENTNIAKVAPFHEYRSAKNTMEKLKSHDIIRPFRQQLIINYEILEADD